MGFWDSVQSVATQLQPLANQVSDYRNQQIQNDVFAANPQFAQAYYGQQNNNSLIKLQQQKQAVEDQKRSALARLAERAGTPGFNPQADRQSFLAQYAAIDPENGFPALLGLGNDGTPSNVRTAQWYAQASPEERAIFDKTNKNNLQSFDLGGQRVFFNPVTGQPIQGGSFDKTLAPADQPDNARNKAAATAQGSATGAAQGTIDTNAVNAPNIIELVSKARKLLPKATSGGLETVGKAANQLLGRSTEASQADSELEIIGQSLTNYVPRFSGPQSDKDVEAYRKAAGDVANTKKPTGDRLAALNTIEELQKKYERQSENTFDFFKSPNNAAPNPRQRLLELRQLKGL